MIKPITLNLQSLIDIHMRKKFLDRLENKQFATHLMILALVLLFSIVLIMYLIASWNSPDKIYNILINIITLVAGFIGGKALSGKEND